MINLTFAPVKVKLVLFSLLLGLGLNQVRACSCKMPDIKFGYTLSSVVFYGRHIGTTTPANFWVMGVPQKLEQFEVVSVIKGYPTFINQTLQQLKQQGKGSLGLSVLSTCTQACGFCFDSGGYYLVYAQVDYPYHLQVSGCSRTRKILNENFLISNASDPSNGLNELKALTQLAQSDTTQQVSRDEAYQQQIVTLSKELKKKTSMSIILSTTTLILVFYVAFGIWRRKGWGVARNSGE